MLAAEADDARKAEILALVRRLDEKLAVPKVASYELRADVDGLEERIPSVLEPAALHEEKAVYDYVLPAVIAGSYGLDLNDDGFEAVVAEATRERRRLAVTRVFA